MKNPVGGPTTDTRRGVLTKLGAGAVALAALPTVSASQRSLDALANGASVDCYFNWQNKFESIFNDVKQWENSFVWLSHDRWDEDVTLRVGEVRRYSNSTIKSKWDAGPTGDNLLMLAGDWTLDDHNVWMGKKGRINTDRCPTAESAYKYWFHEIGHAHGLSHRDEWLGQLMDPHDPEAMHLNASECQQWRNAY